MRWFRLLSAEQDNLHAALRWAVGRGDAGTALRLVRALGYYWVQLGHGEGDGLARAVLALPPPDPPTKETAEARVICAMLAAGWSYDLESVKQQLIDGVAGIAAWSADPGSLHPLAAMGEPLLLQFTGGRELVQQVYDRYATVGDPWLRAMGRFYRAQHASEMGRHRRNRGRAPGRAARLPGDRRAVGDRPRAHDPGRRDRPAGRRRRHDRRARGGGGDRPRAERLGGPGLRRGQARDRPGPGRRPGPRPGRARPDRPRPRWPGAVRSTSTAG